MMALPSVLHAAIDFKYRFPPFVQESTYSTQSCPSASGPSFPQADARTARTGALLTKLEPNRLDFFEPYISTASLASTSTLAAVSKCNGFQRGTQTRWQLVANDGIGAPTLTDMGASFSILTGRVLTLFIAAPPNGSSVWARVVDEVSRAVPSGTPTVRHRMHDETDSLQNTSPRSRPFSVAQRSLGTANTLFRQVMVGGPDYD